MKKFNNRRVLTIFIIIAIILLLVGSILFISLDKKSDKDKVLKNGFYTIHSKHKNREGTVTMTSNKIKASHCLKKICVTDTVVYYVDGAGRLECKITNKSKKKATGYLKLDFGTNSFIVYYDLEPKKSTVAVNSFYGEKISDANDFVLKKLTKEELSHIK